MPQVASLLRIQLRVLLFIAAVLMIFPSVNLHAIDAPTAAAANAGQPTDAKAQKTFKSAEHWQKAGDPGAAIGDYRKANRQDGGHCTACLQKAYALALKLNDFKQAEEIGGDWLAISATSVDKAVSHYRIGLALQRQAISNHKEKCFSESCDELDSALKLVPQFPLAHFTLGVSLAHLHQDDAARSEFAAFLKQDTQDTDLQSRAKRFFDHVDLARARMVPAFSVTTLDGKHINMDGLAGKVVLLDFWATWCAPCREALPDVRRLAQKFQGQPFVVISISLDSDDAKWRAFVDKNEMTWPQYSDGGFGGKIARLFDVNAIPATFSIDADGVVEDQHVGDANLEKSLKKLIAKAEAEHPNKPQTARVGDARQTSN